MQLIIDPCGHARCLYGEAIDLARLGLVSIRRASLVEPDQRGQWTANLSPLRGPVLGPFALRSNALAAEEAWIHEHWLLTPIAP
jgi:hypothetical protein